MSKFDFVTPDGYKSIREIRADLLDPQKLEGLVFSATEVDEILEKFWFRDTYSAFIALESIYPNFIAFLKEREHRSFERKDFYDYHFSGFPEWEQIKTLSQVIEKRMSGDFSLVEFAELEEGLNLSAQELIACNVLITDGKSISIAHHTISEYFVADDLLDNQNTIDEFRKLAVVKVTQTDEKYFNGSWYGVALFLLESEKAVELVKFFIDLAVENPKIVDQNFSEILSNTKLDELPNDLRTKLFGLIFDNSQKSGVWISEWSVAGLVQLFTDDQIALLESGLVDEPEEFDELVRTSNIVALMGQLIESKKISNRSTLDKWKQLFIRYANQRIGSGVLQRRSLKALESFDDESIIEKVKSVFEFKNGGKADQLVQEAFLRLCYEIAPNSETSIGFFLEGFFLSSGRAYAWFGIQKIDDSNSLLNLLERLSEDATLLDKFLEDENIFLNPEDEDEKAFFINIRKLAGSSLKTKFLSTAKKLIYTACDLHNFYIFDRTTFVFNLSQICLEVEPTFWKDLLSNIPEKEGSLNKINVIRLIGRLAKASNYREMFDFVRSNSNFRIEDFIYQIRDSEIRHELLLELGITIEEPESPEEQEKREREKIYKEFKNKLEPVPNRFMTDVFDFYIRNQDKIGKLNSHERERLLFLAYEDGIGRLDPNDFKLKINKYSGGKNFNWSSQAQFYGDMIRVVQKIKPELLKSCKQHLIDFIPFAFSDDLSTIIQCIDEVSDDELVNINKAYIEKDNDRRYLLTSSYIYFIENFKKKGNSITTPESVLKSFIGDEKINESDQISALELLRLFISPNDQYFFDLLKNLESHGSEGIARTVNEILIAVFQDKESIEWRFKKIREHAVPVEPRGSGIVYTLDFPRNEFHSGSLARVLVKSCDLSLSEKFLEFLDFINDFSNKENSDDFVEYGYKVIYDYYENIASVKNYEFFLKLERKIESKPSLWWNIYLPKLRNHFLTKGRGNE